MYQSKQSILSELKAIRQDLKIEGFIIDGIFGSYARDEHTEDSDVDILYHLDQTFCAQNTGFHSFKRLNEIKQTIINRLNKKVDLAPINNLSQTAKEYILSEVVYFE